MKCTITETNISFRAYAREYVIQDHILDYILICFLLCWFRDYEEREYAFDLDFYADVIPKVSISCFCDIFDQISP